MNVQQVKVMRVVLILLAIVSAIYGIYLLDPGYWYFELETVLFLLVFPIVLIGGAAFIKASGKK